MASSASIIVPTRGRPEYLEVALASIVPQAGAAEVIVVEDGPAGACADVAARHGVGYLALGAHRGLNIARNAGLRASTGELVVYVDDDVRAHPGWLAALLAAASDPAASIFAGRIHAVFEGARWRGCGREGPPITALDLGPHDGWAPHAWGANMAIRRTAFAAVGEFDERRSGGGDEEEWQRRHGGPIRYVAGAAVDHRRAGADARLPALARAAFRRGAEVRRFDAEADAPRLGGELRVLAGCVWHSRHCANGLVMAAHSAGRVYACVRPAPGAPTDDFLSGESGTVGGRRDVLRALGDIVLDLTLPRIAPGGARRVLVVTVARAEHQQRVARAGAELARSRHEVTLVSGPAGGLGKFENLNRLLAGHAVEGHDWLLVLDDDVDLPPGFLDDFLALAERLDLSLAQPAHRLRSHAAWRLTRRRPASLARETRFVEIGPVTALRRDTFPALLPFPPLRMGWGLDAHWAAVAAARGWRLGVIDATPIAHRVRPAGDAYSRQQAIDEAREFLADRPYLPAQQSQQTLRVHRRCG